MKKFQIVVVMFAVLVMFSSTAQTSSSVKSSIRISNNYKSINQQEIMRFHNLISKHLELLTGMEFSGEITIHNCLNDNDNIGWDDDMRNLYIPVGNVVDSEFYWNYTVYLTQLFIPDCWLDKNTQNDAGDQLSRAIACILVKELNCEQFASIRDYLVGLYDLINPNDFADINAPITKAKIDEICATNPTVGQMTMDYKVVLYVKLYKRDINIFKTIFTNCD